MEKNGKSFELSLAGRGYLISESFRLTIRQLLLMFAILIAYTIIGVVAIYSGGVQFAKFWLPYVMVIVSGMVLFYYFKTRTFIANQTEWNAEYLQSAYVLVFSTTVPSGNTSAERVFRIASMIFPELRPEYIKFTPYIRWRNILRLLRRARRDSDISKALNVKLDAAYTLDMAFKTERGYFIIKDFKEETITVERLQELTKLIEGKFKDKYFRTNIFRTICVAKTFDEAFLNVDFLEQIMKHMISSSSKIDLLIRDNQGYSVLWVS